MLNICNSDVYVNINNGNVYEVIYSVAFGVLVVYKCVYFADAAADEVTECGNIYIPLCCTY